MLWQVIKGNSIAADSKWCRTRAALFQTVHMVSATVVCFSQNNNTIRFKRHITLSYSLSPLPRGLWIFTAFNLQFPMVKFKVCHECEGRVGEAMATSLPIASPSARVNPPDGDYNHQSSSGQSCWKLSGIYLRGLRSGPKIVWVISLIPAILLQHNCPSPPCRHDHNLGPLASIVVAVFFITADELRHSRAVKKNK